MNGKHEKLLYIIGSLWKCRIIWKIMQNDIVVTRYTNIWFLFFSEKSNQKSYTSRLGQFLYFSLLYSKSWFQAWTFPVQYFCKGDQHWAGAEWLWLSTKPLVIISDNVITWLCYATKYTVSNRVITNIMITCISKQSQLTFF